MFSEPICTMRSTIQLALVLSLALVTAGITPGCTGGNGGSQATPSVARPLVREPYLLQSETRHLDFSNPDSYTALGKGFLQNTSELFANKTIVWATEPKSEVLLRVLSPGDKTLRLKLISNYLPSAVAQKVVVFWEDIPLGEIEFPLESKYGIKEVDFPIPAKMQKIGINHLQFLSRYVLSQKDTGDGQEIRSGAFGIMNLDILANTPSTGDTQQSGLEIKGADIIQAANTRLLFPMDVSGAESLSVALDGMQGRGAISIAWDSPSGVVEYELWRGENSPEKKTLEIPQFAEVLTKPAVVELIFNTSDAPGNSVCTWQNITLLGAPGASKAVAQQEPQVAINPAEIKNVVLVALDALRADALHCYGNIYETSPFIDTLAKGGYLIENHYTAGSFTFSSTASLLTSLYPFQHRVNYWKDRLSDPSLLLQNVLRNNGVYTACISQNSFISESNVLASNFDKFLPLYWEANTDSHATVDETLKLTETLREKPFFMYAHFLPPHSPYTMAGPYSETFSYDPMDKLPLDSNELKKINQGLIPHTSLSVEQLRIRYYECLRYGDDLVKWFVEGLRAQGYGKETLLIITSDHGEEFMEHNWIGHGTFPYDTMQHIPLIVTTVNEGGLLPEGGLRLGSVHKSVDLFPTICELLEVDNKNPVMGRSLLHPNSEPVQNNTVQSYGTGNNEYIVEAYRFRDYKLLVSRIHAWRGLYNYTLDPSEQSNLAELQPILCDYLQASGEAWKKEQLEKRGALETVQSETIQNEDKLRGLGYL